MSDSSGRVSLLVPTLMIISQALAALKNILLSGLEMKSFTVLDNCGASATHHRMCVYLVKHS
jgi:hypothetical protein